MKALKGFAKILLFFFAIVLVHEFGHFLACLAFGVPVREFSVGIGPALADREWRGTLFVFKALPFGGYNEMDGRVLFDQPLFVQTMIGLSGSLFCFAVTLLAARLVARGKGPRLLVANFFINVGLPYSLVLWGERLNGWIDRADRPQTGQGTFEARDGLLGPSRIMRGIASSGWEGLFVLSAIMNGVNLAVVPFFDGGKIIAHALMSAGATPGGAYLVVAGLLCFGIGLVLIIRDMKRRREQEWEGDDDGGETGP